MLLINVRFRDYYTIYQLCFRLIIIQFYYVLLIIISSLVIITIVFVRDNINNAYFRGRKSLKWGNIYKI